MSVRSTVVDKEKLSPDEYLWSVLCVSIMLETFWMRGRTSAPKKTVNFILKVF